MLEHLFYEKVQNETNANFFYSRHLAGNIILHLHEEVEVLLVQEGDMYLLVNNKKIHLKTGDIAIINTLEPHETMFGSKPCMHLVLQFDPHRIFNGINDTKDIRCTTYHMTACDNEVYKTTKYLLEKLYDEYKNDDYRMLTTDSLLGFFYSYILRNLSWEYINLTKFDHQLDDIDRLKKAIDYISLNYSKKITINDVARETNYSVSHFSRFFKRMTGDTFVGYLSKLRIYKAESLLITTDKQIGEISVECGFTSIKTFNRIFANKHPASPRKFRLQNKIKK